jgi:hypothetical protein
MIMSFHVCIRIAVGDTVIKKEDLGSHLPF